MKKLLIGVLSLLTCFTCATAVACDESGNNSGNNNTSALEDAKNYLDVLYGEKDMEVYTDYTVLNSTAYDGIVYSVSWSVSGTDKVTVEKRDTDTLINVDETITEEVEYVLTATIYDADGNSTTISFTRKVLVLVTDEISAPQENVAYNMYIEQLTVGSNLLLTGNMNDKWFEMTTDNSKAANVYAEKVSAGYKFYVLGENDAKSYITLEEYQKDNGYWGAHVSYTEVGSVFYFDAAGCWASKLEHDTFFLGTYGSYDTASASASNYMKAENMGVSQYPLLLATPGSIKGGEIEGLPTVEEPEAGSTLTISEANELATKLAHDTTTKGKFYVIGVISSIVKDDYGNLYIKDENDNALYVYGTYSADGKVKYGDWADAPQVGDTVKLYGVLSNYNGPQMKNAWVVEINGEKVEGGNTDTPVETPTYSTPEEILTALYALSDGESLTGPFTLTGEITELDSYNNPTIVVEGFEDKPVYCFKLKVTNVVGDVITVKAGSMKNYQGTYEFMDCTLVTEDQGGGNESGGETTEIATLTIPEALKLGASKSHDTYTEEKYYVTGIIESVYNTQYGNMYIVDEAGNKITVYGTYDADGTNAYNAMENAPVAGDVVKLLAIVGQYSNTPQLKNAWIVEVSAATDAQKLAIEKNAVSVVESISGARTIELATAGTLFTDVTITWEVTAGNEVASIANGVLTTINPEAETTVTLKAIITAGETSEELTFTITVSHKEAVSGEETLATFTFGDNGTTGHVDGADVGTSKTYSDNGYDLELTNCSKVFGGAKDETGVSALKLGTSSVVATFTFTVGEDVDKVIINVAMYKAKTTKITINGTEYSITTSSNDGAYTPIEIDTTTTKTITLSTVSNACRAMVDSIVFIAINE